MLELITQDYNGFVVSLSISVCIRMLLNPTAGNIPPPGIITVKAL